MFARARLAFDRDLTLGVVAGRLAAIHGRRTMVDEEGWVVSFREAADLVERWSAAVEAAGGARRAVLAVPNGYRQLLATLAVAWRVASPPVNAQMRPVEIEHVVDDAGATLVVRDTSELDRRPPGAGRAGASSGSAGTRRPRGALLHVGDDGPAKVCSSAGR